MTCQTHSLVCYMHPRWLSLFVKYSHVVPVQFEGIMTVPPALPTAPPALPPVPPAVV